MGKINNNRVYKQRQSVFSHTISLFATLSYVGIFYYFVMYPYILKNGVNFNAFEVFILSIFPCVDTLPSLLLYINYIFMGSYNRIDIYETKIVIHKRRETTEIKNLEIKKIVFYSLDKKKALYFYPSWFTLYCGRIFLKDGGSYLFTCLDGIFIKSRLMKMRGVYFNTVTRFPLIQSEEEDLKR